MTEPIHAATTSGLGYAYAGRPEALVDVTLRLDAGRIVVILGPNGSGKSTLLALLAGRLVPTRGALQVITPTGRRTSRVGYAAQATELDPEMRVEEHLRLFASLAGRRGHDAHEDVSSALARFGLEEVREMLVARLSGGMRRRVHLAVSCLGEPTLWLLDEPTTGLDPNARERLAEALREHRGRGGTAVLVTHELGFAQALADEVVWLDAGRLVAHEAMAAALEHDGELGRAYAARFPQAALPPVAEASAHRSGGGGGGGGGRGGGGGGRRHARGRDA